MRAWTSALAVAGLALSLGALAVAEPITAGRAEGRTQGWAGAGRKHVLVPCLQQGERGLVRGHAVAGRPDTWKYARWAQFKRGQCGSAGTFPREESYWYAEDGNNPGVITYPGQDAQGCIGDKNFERTVTGAYSCLEDERITGFHKITEQMIREGITLSD